MLFGLRHTYLANIKWIFFVVAYFCHFSAVVVVRHILDNNRSQLLPQDI